MLHAFLAFDGATHEEVFVASSVSHRRAWHDVFSSPGKTPGKIPGKWLSFTVFSDPGIFPGKTPGKWFLFKVLL